MIDKYNESLFEEIKHIDEDGNEYWSARELQNALQYKEWRNFNLIIEKAKIACNRSQGQVESDFVEADKIVEAGAMCKKINDYKLSRYACYLIAQNGDPNKEIIALAQTYFAVKTRLREIFEMDYDELTEDEKRIYNRELTRKHNNKLNHTAKEAGVKNFDKFHNAGYKGLYGGETADDIAKRKGLRYREEILDNMGSEELIDNLFRIVHTDQKMKKDNVKGEKESCDTHYKMGKDIRNFIKKHGGTMPEDLPTPKKSIKDIKKEKRNEIKGCDLKS
jgi:DNA-damage-inducible protein D